MLSFEGGDMDQDCVSFLQGYCPAVFIIILLMEPYLFLLKPVSIPVGPSDVFP